MVPAFEEERRLARCLDAAHASPLPAGIEWLEWIVVNDGSTDRTVAVAEAWAAAHPSLRVVVDSLAVRAGKGQALRRAHDQIRARHPGDVIVVHTDADSAVEPNCLRALLQPLLEDAGICVTWGKTLPDDRRGWGRLAGRFQLLAVAEMTERQRPDSIRAEGRLFALRLGAFSDFSYRLGYVSEDQQLARHVADRGIGRLVVPGAIVRATPPAGWRDLYAQTYRDRLTYLRQRKERGDHRRGGRRRGSARAFLATAWRHPIGAAAYVIADVGGAFINRFAPLAQDDAWEVARSTKD